MALNVPTQSGPFEFEGPHTNNNLIRNISGVYIITTRNTDGSPRILDVGEAGRLVDRLDTHERADCWKRHGRDGIYAWVLYCDEAQRMRIENEVRKYYNPPCGIR